MTSLAPLAALLAFGLFANLYLLTISVQAERKAQRRERRNRAVARELNSRRWIFTQQIAARGGSSRVPSSERWPA